MNIVQHNNKHITGPFHRKMHKTLKKLLSPDDGWPDDGVEKENMKFFNGYSIEEWKTSKLHTKSIWKIVVASTTIILTREMKMKDP